MPKIILIGVFAIIIFVFILLKVTGVSFNIKSIADIFQKPPLPQSKQRQSPSPSPKTQDLPEEIVLGTKDNLQDQVKKTAATVNNFLDQTADKLLGKKQQTTVVIDIIAKESSSNQSNQNTTQIDLLKDRGLKINMPKNTKYYFEFQNVPSDFCLYIAKQQYKIESTKIVALTLLESGTYPVSLDFCDLENKSIGNIIVN